MGVCMGMCTCHNYALCSVRVCVCVCVCVCMGRMYYLRHLLYIMLTMSVHVPYVYVCTMYVSVLRVGGVRENTNQINANVVPV